MSTPSPAPHASPSLPSSHDAALRFITCGSVDDGKSTLIGRLLLDSKTILQDQLASASKSGKPDLALFTDGLLAEREQGITIDVAYRYFATPKRKFIIGDAPGHEQYTRNMVTAASCTDAAVVLVDANKLAWQDPALQLLPQTKRHSMLAQLLAVPHIIFAVNKLDAVADPSLAFAHIAAALRQFADKAHINVTATIPISALEGYNVVSQAQTGWAGYTGPSLLGLLETLPNTGPEQDPGANTPAMALPVQWVEKFASSSDTSQGRRTYWGEIATGQARAGQAVRIFPSGEKAKIVRIYNHTRQETSANSGIESGHSAGIVLDREVDVSRGDYILAEDFICPQETKTTLHATVAWMDNTPLVAGRVYWALHGRRWIKTKVQRILHSLDIQTLNTSDAQELHANGIGEIELQLLQAIPALSYKTSKRMGSLILVDPASNQTAGAVLVK